MGRKKTTALGCAGALFACIAVLALFTVLSVWPKTRTPPVDIYDLALDASPFPEGWVLCGGSAAPLPKREYGERASVYEWFCPEGFDGIGGASHEVYRYRNELDAAIVFELDFADGEFPRWHMVEPWAMPSGWTYQSPVADRFVFACGRYEGAEPSWACNAVAQYSEYISVFTTHLSPDNMTLDDVQRILRSIDDRMALYLQKHAD